MQWVDARPGTDPNVAANALVKAIDVDPLKAREHTEWLSVALRWDKAERDRSLLLRGKDLHAAEGWIARGDVELAPIPLQYALVTASRTAERRRLRTVLSATLITLALTAALAVTALVQRTEAVNQRDQARSCALAAAAQSQLDVDPERALLLASAAWSQAPTPQAVTALRSSVERSRIRVRIAAHKGMVADLAWSADGRTVLSAGQDGTVAAWDATTGAAHGRLNPGDDGVGRVLGSTAGIAITGPGRAVLWSSTRRPVSRPNAPYWPSRAPRPGRSTVASWLSAWRTAPCTSRRPRANRAASCVGARPQSSPWRSRPTGRCCSWGPTTTRRPWVGSA